MAVDKFVWDHQDFVVVTSVGDQGRTDVSSTVRPRPIIISIFHSQGCRPSGFCSRPYKGMGSRPAQAGWRGQTTFSSEVRPHCRHSPV
jgi:hypothetical protein